MRQDILDYIRTNLPAGFKASNELPWSEREQSLPEKNLKTVYVTETETVIETLIPIIGSSTGIRTQVDTVQAILVYNAKNIPENLAQAINVLRGATSVTVQGGNYYKQESQLAKSIDGDTEQVEVTYDFTKLLT